MFKNDSSWKCNGCYAPNKADVMKCACCGGLKPGATEPSGTGEKSLTASIGKISFGVTSEAGKAAGGSGPIVFGSTAEKKDEKVAFDFGSKSMFGGGAAQATKSVFGTPSAPTPLFGVSFKLLART